MAVEWLSKMTWTFLLHRSAATSSCSRVTVAKFEHCYLSLVSHIFGILEWFYDNFVSSTQFWKPAQLVNQICCMCALIGTASLSLSTLQKTKWRELNIIEGHFIQNTYTGAKSKTQTKVTNQAKDPYTAQIAPNTFSNISRSSSGFDLTYWLIACYLRTFWLATSLFNVMETK